MSGRFTRWMAKWLLKRQQWRHSLRWHQRWGIDRMTPEKQVGYAELLYDNGQADEAIKLLSKLLSRTPLPQAYECRAHMYNEQGKEEEAIADLDEAIRLDPGPYLYWYSRAIAHHDRGEYRLAVRDFQEALKRKADSEKASTFYELGNVYMKMGLFHEAEYSYRQAAANPDKAIPHYYYRLAQSLEKLNRSDEALKTLQEGIKLQERWFNSSDRGAGMLKERTNYSEAAVDSLMKGAQEECGFRLYESRLLENMGDLEQALVSIQKAQQCDAASAELLLRKGMLLRQLDRYEESRTILKDLIEKNPLWLHGYMELSTTYRLQGKHNEAVATLQIAKQHFPDNMVVRYWLADAYREADRLQEALEENKVLTDREPDDPLNWKQRAELAIDMDRYNEADEAYTEALKFEASADYYMRRSFVRFMADRYEEAMMDIQAAVKLDESLMSQSKTAYALGELYAGMENWELAETEFSRAIALEPDNPQMYDRRARCRFAAGRLQEALDDCNRALLLDGTNARLIWLRGFIHYRLDEYNAALMDSLTYARMLPEDPQGHYNLGLVYKQLDRYDDAIASYSKVLELNPFEAQAYLERASIMYHHAFDRSRAAHDLAQWLLYAGGEKQEGDRFALLNELRGFDDEMRERAKEQFINSYGTMRYLS
ncbi:hypothetical protein SD71_16795 [Cohnella kolymensis]|uniref:Tetratricopeptide repeat protein n=1 Tax=Cohnella kolymensis TaxID=1590652 RepID=A0ABR5A0Z3_9BACL|nr:tetratricopeptide repeat protein [Cohnella kolymensis]KIL34724.1 hypothetical protein SD71_16795 [Cohnella kolymensis]